MLILIYLRELETRQTADRQTVHRKMAEWQNEFLYSFQLCCEALIRYFGSGNLLKKRVKKYIF